MMDTCFEVDKSFYDIDSAEDLKQFWETELDPVSQSTFGLNESFINENIDKFLVESLKVV